MDQASIFSRQTAFVAANAASAGGTIAFAIQLGDLVQNHEKVPSEWAAADAAISLLDGALPFGIVPGNHDYDSEKSGKLEKGDTFCSYFGPESRHFAGKPWYGGSFDGGLDSWAQFEAGGASFLFIGLELEPSDESLEWARRVLAEHAGMPTILATHEYLSSYDDPKEPGVAMRLGASYRRSKDRNGAQQIWDKLIRENKQIFLVLCGHHYTLSGEGENSRVDLDDEGFPVYQFLSDYQGRNEIQRAHGIREFPGRCGDGWMRLINIDLETGTLQVRTYSTELNRYETDADSGFTINFDWDREARFAD
jgi:Predicted phosphohydrolases